MKPLLEPLRQIGTDLVQKRLWPVALALLVGLIAVTVIGTSGEDASPELMGRAPVTATAPAVPATATPGERTAERADNGTRVRNPFFDPPKQPDASSGRGSASDSAAEPSSGPRAAGSSQLSDDRPSSPGPVPKAPSGAARVPSTGAGASTANVYYRTVIRWRRAKPSRSTAIARLTPLGGRSEPAALYLGVTAPDERYAIFVLGPNTTTHASHHCADPSDCRMIGLRAGETKLLTVRPPNGGVRHYRLRVAAIRRVKSSLRHARVMRGDVHRDGRGVLRAFWRDPAIVPVISTVSYSRARGLLSARNAEVSVTKPGG